jgi:2-dehydro-3-deoxygluconokinase
VACAVSDTLAAAVVHAAETAARFVYDPNFRPRLTSTAQAAAVLRRLAPLADVITPSWPGETRQLLGLGSETPARDALAALAALGARRVALTLGPQGVLVAADGEVHEVPGVPAPVVVDQTGAGDCLTGALAARLALGDSLIDAVRLAASAAALSVQGQGGTGYVPTLGESREALAASRSTEELTPR